MKYQVAVIGAGVIGVTSALEIQSRLGRDCAVTIISDQFSPNTTGDVSAGLWTPYLLQDTPMDKIIQWSKDTQDFLRELWRGGYAHEAGIALVPMVELLSKGDATPEWKSIAYGGSTLTRGQLARYSVEHGTVYNSGFHFVSFICEPSKLLPFLTQKFLQNGGEIKAKKVNDFRELEGGSFDVIVNCTGLNAKYLSNDRNVAPIRGQIHRVKANWMNHMIMSNEHYIIPNLECVILGGTHQEDDYDLGVRQTDKDFILKGCYSIIPALKNASILTDQVGLRPGRDQVRLELELASKASGRTVPVVHNYGHGGAGVTMSVGCAREACQLVDDALKLYKNKL